MTTSHTPSIKVDDVRSSIHFRYTAQVTSPHSNFDFIFTQFQHDQVTMKKGETGSLPAARFLFGPLLVGFSTLAFFAFFPFFSSQSLPPSSSSSSPKSLSSSLPKSSAAAIQRKVSELALQCIYTNQIPDVYTQCLSQPHYDLPAESFLGLESLSSDSSLQEEKKRKISLSNQSTRYSGRSQTRHRF